MNKSDDIKELLDALFQAKLEIPDVPMKGINPHFKSKFIKLGDALEVIKPIFVKHKLMLVQSPYYMGDTVYVETMIFHVPSGQYMSSETGSPAKGDPQGTGAAITYLRRFGLVSMLCLCEEDDDGEGAMGRREPDMDRPVKAPVEPSKTKPDHNLAPVPSNILAKLTALIINKGISTEMQDAILRRAKVGSLDKLTTEQALKTIEWLEGRPSQGENKL